MKRSIIAAGVTGLILAGPQLAGPAIAGGKPASTGAGIGAAERPDPQVLARQSAARLVSSRAPQLKLAKGDRVGSPTVYAADGIQYVAYERTHRGLPVVGGDFVVVTNALGRILNTTVAQRRTVEVASTQPTVARSAARKVASRVLDKTAKIEGTRLVVLQRKGSQLAWETTVSGRDHGHDARRTVFVDALTGAKLMVKDLISHGTGQAGYSGPNPVTINTQKTFNTYYLRDPESTSLQCQSAGTYVAFSGSDDSWGNGDPTNRETACVDALYGAQQMKAMLSTWLGRDGMNGNGGWLPIRVGLNEVNAYYDGNQVQIGHSKTGGRWISTLDIVSHEFGHGVDHRTPGGMSAGGTQEFVADVFGMLTEHYDNQPAPFDVPDWALGEEADLLGAGPIRDLANPSALGDPDCYSSSIPSQEVHDAAGPGDHWFYLLAQGSAGSSTCNGSTLQGIGIQQAGKIMYNAMLMKTSTSSYLKYRTWTLTAAKNLDPTCAQFSAVKAAWDAVSVPAQAADPTCFGSGNPGTPTNPGGTGQLLLNPGFESGATGWSGAGNSIFGPVTNNLIKPARTGNWKLWLGGEGYTKTETVNQTVAIPATTGPATLSYWIRTDTYQSGSKATDSMRVQVVVDGTPVTLQTFTNLDSSSRYAQFSHDLSTYKGKTVTIRFTSTEDSAWQTSFVVDDTALTVS